MRYPKDTLEERFWAKVKKTDDCWFWTASLNGSGYGYFKVNKRTAVAHRVAYEWEVGPIPEGLTLDHLCRNRDCVRPDHLEPVEEAVNILRGEGWGAMNARKTHCPQGHPYDEKNTYIRPSGSCRECRKCAKARKKARRQS